MLKEGNMKENYRITELDALRGIAALSVVLFHYTSKYDEIFTQKVMQQYEFSYGYLGVQLFFIISGFVIFMTISNVKSGLEFIYKRFIRLYPLFWICLIFTFIITSISNIKSLERSWTEFFINLSMIPSLLKTRTVDGVYWSLIPELFFYGFIWLVYKLGLLKRIVFISVIWLILSLFSKFIIGNSYLNIVVNTDFSYLFIAGINFYILYNKKATLINHLLIICTFVVGLFFNSITESIFCFFFYILFYLLTYNSLTFLNFLKPLSFVGVISYPLYLIHQFFGLILINKLNLLGLKNYFILLLIPIIMSIAISWMITKFVEKPILLQIKKLSYKFLDHS